MAAPDLAGELAALKADVELYYTAKVRRHGATPPGVDWICQPTQELRLVQLLRVCDFSAPFTLNDLGCGYGALVGLLGRRHRASRIDYLGIDISPAMIEQARNLWTRRRNAAFCVADRSPRAADYSLASGVFNVRLTQPVPLWERYIEDTLRDLAAASRRGFAVNFLDAPARGAQGQPELYRTGPHPWIGFCQNALGCRVELLDAYGMREFTLLARR